MFNCCCSNNVDDFDEKNNEFKAELLDTDFFLNSNSEIQNKQNFKYGIDFVHRYQGAQNGCFKCKKQVCGCGMQRATDPKTYNEEKKFFKLFFTKEAIEELDGNFLKLNDNNKFELKTLEKKIELNNNNKLELKTLEKKKEGNDVVCFYFDKKKNNDVENKENNIQNEGFRIGSAQEYGLFYSVHSLYYNNNKNGVMVGQIKKEEMEKLNKKLKSLKEELKEKNKEIYIENVDIVLPGEQKEVINKDNNVSENNENENEINTNVNNINNNKQKDLSNDSSIIENYDHEEEYENDTDNSAGDKGINIKNIKRVNIKSLKQINSFNFNQPFLDKTKNVDNKEKQNIDYTKYSYTITVKNSENKKIEFCFSDNAVEKTEGNVFELMDYNNSVNGRQDTIYENGVFFIDYVDEKDEKKENKEFDDKNYVDKTVEKEENKKKLLVLSNIDGIKFCFGKGIRENEELFSVDNNNFKKQFHFSSPSNKTIPWCSSLCFSLENEHENKISKT